MRAMRWARRSGAATVLVLAAIVASGLPVEAAGVDDNKTFTIDIDGTVSSASWAGDADASITITIHNTSPTQGIEAANVTFPTPLFAVSAADTDDAVLGGPVVELRDLAIAPRSQKAVTITADVRTCGSTTSPLFGVDVRQSNNFSGTGNLFFQDPDITSDRVVEITGNCKLAFVAPPTDAEVGARITSVPFMPGGAPISVEVRDAGNTGRATHSTASISLSAAYATADGPVSGVIGGTTNATAAAGVATFSPGPTLSPGAFGYTMTAASGALVPGVSPSFVIVDDRVVCASGNSCTASVTKQGQTTTASFGPGGANANLLLLLGAGDAPEFECEGYPRPPGQLISQFEFTGGNADAKTGTLSFTIPNATKPLKEYQACWAAPYQFTTITGVPGAELVGFLKGGTQTVYFGLLPDCAKRDPDAPCVSARSYNRSTKSATVTVFTTGEDPWGY
jgi:hypothetical protein